MFGLLYIVIGKRVWFFPNILAEEATLRELFRFCPNKDEEERPKWTTRLFYAVVAVVVILLLRHHAPDEAARARSDLHLLILTKFATLVLHRHNGTLVIALRLRATNSVLEILIF